MYLFIFTFLYAYIFIGEQNINKQINDTGRHMKTMLSDKSLRYKKPNDERNLLLNTMTFNKRFKSMFPQGGGTFSNLFWAFAATRPHAINCATESAAHTLHSTRLQGGWEEEEEEEEEEQEGAPGQVTNTV